MLKDFRMCVQRILSWQGLMKRKLYAVSSIGKSGETITADCTFNTLFFKFSCVTNAVSKFYLYQKSFRQRPKCRYRDRTKDAADLLQAVPRL